ncbi:Hypothetical predicted protein [Olea europaea subsp. europaea]|uniref:Uncharacterized protein n=1 Tax=Olea europaea subsp. europaea TaxID=158383 RepID=A0A8S0TM26_OLEEU|nr:Hypothetical predicted protein [Olea europaea subsp. europaea]
MEPICGLNLNQARDELDSAHHPQRPQPTGWRGMIIIVDSVGESVQSNRTCPRIAPSWVREIKLQFKNLVQTKQAKPVGFPIAVCLLGASQRMLKNEFQLSRTRHAHARREEWKTKWAARVACVQMNGREQNRVQRTAAAASAAALVRKFKAGPQADNPPNRWPRRGRNARCRVRGMSRAIAFALGPASELISAHRACDSPLVSCRSRLCVACRGLIKTFRRH